MGFFSHDKKEDENTLVENTQRLNVNDEGEQKQGWSTGAKVAAGLGAAAVGAAAIGGGAYAYKKHQENQEDNGGEYSC